MLTRSVNFIGLSRFLHQGPLRGQLPKPEVAYRPERKSVIQSSHCKNANTFTPDSSRKIQVPQWWQKPRSRFVRLIGTSYTLLGVALERFRPGSTHDEALPCVPDLRCGTRRDNTYETLLPPVASSPGCTGMSSCSLRSRARRVAPRFRRAVMLNLSQS